VGDPGRLKAGERVIVEGQNLKPGMPVQTKAFKADVQRSNQRRKGIRTCPVSSFGGHCSDCHRNSYGNYRSDHGGGIAGSQFPNIAPPQIMLQPVIPAQTQRPWKTVSVPIEQQINGVDNMTYMYSLNALSTSKRH